MLILNNQEVKVTMFPDKTSQVWQLPPGLIDRRNQIVWRFESESELIHLAQLFYLLRSYGRSADLHIPFLPYGRQDKAVTNNTTFALKVFIDLLNVMTFRSVTIFDPHNYDAVMAIDNVQIITPYQQIREALMTTDADVIVFPDKGAYDRYGDLFRADGFPSIVGEKSRDPGTGAITGLVLPHNAPGENVLIVDDICDGGATFIALAKQLMGSATISLYVSHGIFSRGLEVLHNSGIKRIFTQDGEIHK